MGSDVEVESGSVAELVVALDDVEPVFDVGERFGPDVVDVGAVVAGVAAAFHEAGAAQDAQVLADEWLAASEGVREPGGGAGLVRERPHDSLACWVGEQVERGQAGRPRPPVPTRGMRVARVMHRCFVVYPDCVQLCGLRATGRGGASRICPTSGPCLTFLGCQGHRGAAQPAGSARAAGGRHRRPILQRAIRTAS